MTDRSVPEPGSTRGSGPLTAPSGATLGILVALGLAQLAWALFQWNQLIVHRAGEEAFCGIAALGDCTLLWDSPFAQAVRSFTALPVAAWGVVWGIAAAALPLIAGFRQRSGKTIDPFWSAAVVTALAGAAGVVVLLTASATTGTLCSNCVGTYLLVAAYAAVALFAAFKRGPLSLAPGAATAIAPVAAAYLILLYPALQTPSAQPITALVEAAGPAAEQGSGDDPVSPAELEEGLRKLLTQLQPEGLQLLSDALSRYRSAPQVPVRETRSLIGDPQATVKLTEFADLLCSHCANLHVQLSALRAEVPPTILSIEPRYFPLDSRCNPEISQPLPPYTTPDTRCVAAKTMICAGGTPRAFELAGRLFENQAALTPERIVSIASEFLPEAELRTCIDSEETAAALSEDIAWATEHGIQGTPLVLLNGRRIPTSGLLIYALLLAGGDPNHPAFASLPDPQEPEPTESPS